MQSEFTVYMKKTHLNDMFQCEHCDKTLESAMVFLSTKDHTCTLNTPVKYVNEDFSFQVRKKGT